MIYAQVFVDSRNWVTRFVPSIQLRDPTPLMTNELDRGIEPNTNGRPYRYMEGWTLPFGMNTKWVNNEPVEMTAEDIATRDAEAEAAKIAKEHADQAAKPQHKKNREKKAKDALIALGLPVPVPPESGDAMIDYLEGMLDQLLAEDKIKESIDLIKNILSAMFLFVMLGDDIYAPFIGEGAE